MGSENRIICFSLARGFCIKNGGLLGEEGRVSSVSD